MSLPVQPKGRLSPRMKVRALHPVPAMAAVRGGGLNALPEKVNHRGGRASLHQGFFHDGA
jgi:hypothetical protein